MNDWKSTLSALTGYTPSAEPEATESVEETNSPTLPPKQQKLRLSMERAGRGGKTVTLVRGFVGSVEEAQALCKLLKQKIGVGGSAKDGDIIIQGDHRARLLEILKAEGYTQTR